MRKINNFGHFGSHKMDIFLRSPVFKIKGFRQNFPIPYTVLLPHKKRAHLAQPLISLV